MRKKLALKAAQLTDYQSNKFVYAVYFLCLYS